MTIIKNTFPVALCFLLLIITSCTGNELANEDIKVPVPMDEKVRDNLRIHTAAYDNNNIVYDDSTRLEFARVLQFCYAQNNYRPVWCSNENWKPVAGDFIGYIAQSAADGLFPEDYHFSNIQSLKNRLDTDSLSRTNDSLWARAEILLTDAYLHVLQDIRQGRLLPDSLLWKNDPLLYNTFFNTWFNKLDSSNAVSEYINVLHPQIPEYTALRSSLKSFLNSMDTLKYTYLEYPYNPDLKADSNVFIKKLTIRLKESGIGAGENSPDSNLLASLLKKYQKQQALKQDGKITQSLVRHLNNTGLEKFIRISITLDRYKQMPDSMPDKYIMVNIPAYELTVWESDTMVFTSRVICGKPATATPSITSEISDLVIYPTWTVPTSIIRKELLPGLKRSSNYLARKGLRLMNYKGQQIDPSSVNWSKYSSGIPYKVQQGSGDNNALGVLKFNFHNPYSVYLHDTNQRYLFKNSFRALSHGCVRVQEWEKLADFIVRKDSILTVQAGDSMHFNTDSLKNWIAAKSMHKVDLKHRFPLFIRYFGCAGIKGATVFYEDIYDEDKKERELFFAHK